MNRIPAPSDHAPRKFMYVNGEKLGCGEETNEEAYIESDYTLEVKQ